MGYGADKAVINVDCLLGVVEYIVEEEDKATSRHSQKGNSAEEFSNQIISILIDCSVSRLSTEYLGLAMAAQYVQLWLAPRHPLIHVQVLRLFTLVSMMPSFTRYHACSIHASKERYHITTCTWLGTKDGRKETILILATDHNKHPRAANESIDVAAVAATII
jgi:hypothetical protein